MFRDYNPETDFKAVKRIWIECGWIDDDKAEAKLIKSFFKEGDTVVGLIDDTPECCVNGAVGTIEYGKQHNRTTLSLGAIAAVTTSHVARRSGFAAMLTAEMMSRQANAGADVCALGMFDQGFYNKLGFGNGSYERWINFDPQTLNVARDFRPPKRLTTKDYKAMHAATVNRLKDHGAVCLDSLSSFKAELEWTENPFGLGYFDGPNGELTHYIWGEMKDENGPYIINWRAYQNHDQLMELLALIRSLGDQVNQIGTLEFGEIQMQDLISRPFRNRRGAEKGKYEQGTSALAYWQCRILNLANCIAACRFDRSVSFNLELTDPAPQHLPDGNNWPGVNGQFVIHLGPESRAEEGVAASLPAMKASINAFSRLWFGVQSASSLAVTDDLAADAPLLQALDATIALPSPHLGWDF